jgi:hypothetical protein
MKMHAALAAPLFLTLPAFAADPPVPLEPTHWGACVGAVGDADLDGFSEVIVGAWWNDARGKHGSATVYSGHTGKELFTVRGDEEGALFGLSVAGSGDVDDDSAQDFMVGAPFEKVKGKPVGVVRVYSGKDGKLLHEIEGKREGERFGWSVNTAGDVDQDGFEDIVIGAPYGEGAKKAITGAARVYSGKTGKLLYEFVGEQEGDQFGFSVDTAGDCDGDGKSVVLVGAWAGGYARVFQGRKGEVLHEIEAPSGDARYAWCVRTAGDTNQDGSSDLIIGAPWDEKVGAYVLSGKKKTPLLFELARATEPGQEAWSFGVAVDTAGDINADGFSDVIVGDPGFPALLGDGQGGRFGPLLSRVREKVARPGKAFVYDGHKGELLYSLTGDKNDDWFGVSVGTAGDVNQDGFADFVVGAGKDSTFQARIYNGQNGEVLYELKTE